MPLSFDINWDNFQRYDYTNDYHTISTRVIEGINNGIGAEEIK